MACRRTFRCTKDILFSFQRDFSKYKTPLPKEPSSSHYITVRHPNTNPQDKTTKQIRSLALMIGMQICRPLPRDNTTQKHKIKPIANNVTKTRLTPAQTAVKMSNSNRSKQFHLYIIRNEASLYTATTKFARKTKQKGHALFTKGANPCLPLNIPQKSICSPQQPWAYRRV